MSRASQRKSEFAAASGWRAAQPPGLRPPWWVSESLGAPAEAAGAGAPGLGSAGQWFGTRKVKRRNETEPYNVKAMGTRGAWATPSVYKLENTALALLSCWAAHLTRCGHRESWACLLAPDLSLPMALPSLKEGAGGARVWDLRRAGDQWLKACVSPRPTVSTGWSQTPGSPWGWGAGAPDMSFSQRVPSRCFFSLPVLSSPLALRLISVGA